MRNMLKKLGLIALLFASFTGLAHAQTALTQTTLAAAMNVGTSAGASGQNVGNFDTTVNLTSATGVTQAFNGQPVTIAYIGNEAMGILTTTPGQTTIFNVLRGMFGTRIGPHPSGDMVLLQVITPQFGGFTGSGGLQTTDPPYNGTCTTANTLVTPWVNMQTGAQWLCSTITKTWVPSWNNQYLATPKVTAAVASAAGQVTPSGPLFHITGALAITGFLIPPGFNATASGGGCFTVIPDGTFTWTTANNIAIAGTAVVNVLLSFCWDATAQKWVPSYVMA
jgi:hypothetical protein